MLKRSVTGLVLGLVMISGLLYSIHSAALLFLIIMIFSSMEWKQHFTKSFFGIAGVIWRNLVLSL